VVLNLRLELLRSEERHKSNYNSTSSKASRQKAFAKPERGQTSQATNGQRHLAAKQKTARNMNSLCAGGARYLVPPVRKEGALVQMDALLPRELWSECLDFVYDSTFESRQFKFNMETREFEFFKPAKLGPLPLRLICPLFAHLALELITDIQSNCQISLKPLVFVLLARPRGLKSIHIGRLLGSTSELVSALFGQLAHALELEEIQIFRNFELVVPGPLLCAIGERCTKLTMLYFHEIGLIDGLFDSPTAFCALKHLGLYCESLVDMRKEERDEISPPDFSHFKSLTHVEGVLWNLKWANSLANAPSVKKIDEFREASVQIEGGRVIVGSLHLLTENEMRIFLATCKGKPLSRTLESLNFCEAAGAREELGIQDKEHFSDTAAIALLDAFPMLKRLDLDWCEIEYEQPLLVKLKSMQHLEYMCLSSSDSWPGPKRSWLEASCSMLPKSLAEIRFYSINWEEMFDEGQEEQPEDFMQFIEAATKSCLPSIEVVFEYCD